LSTVNETLTLIWVDSTILKNECVSIDFHGVMSMVVYQSNKDQYSHRQYIEIGYWVDKYYLNIFSHKKGGPKSPT